MSEWEGNGNSGGRRAANSRLQLSTGLFEGSMSPVIGPDKLRETRRRLTNTGVNIKPISPI